MDMPVGGVVVVFNRGKEHFGSQTLFQVHHGLDGEFAQIQVAD
jgi:hypothetical protein